MSTNENNTNEFTISDGMRKLIHQLTIQAVGDRYNPEKVEARLAKITDMESWKTTIEKAKASAEEFQNGAAKEMPITEWTVGYIRDLNAETGESTETETMTEAQGWETYRQLRRHHGLNKATRDQWHECRRRLEHAGKSKEEISEMLKGLTHSDVDQICKEYSKAPLKDDDAATKGMWFECLRRLRHAGLSEEETSSKLKGLSVAGAREIKDAYGSAPRSPDAPATRDQWHECRRRLQYAGKSYEEIGEMLKNLTHARVNEIYDEFEKASSKSQKVS
jgi:hypothetical protein